MASNSAAAPALLVFAGALIITQTLFGQALERLGLKAALTGGSSSSSSAGDGQGLGDKSGSSPQNAAPLPSSGLVPGVTYGPFTLGN